MRVVALGLLTLDVIQTVDCLPRPNEKITANSTSLDYGGPAANAAATAKVLGSEVTLVSAVGEGVAAQAVRAELQNGGIDLMELEGELPQMPVSTVLVTEGTGERAVVSSHRLSTGTFRLPPGTLTGASVLLLDGHYLPAGIQAAKEARQLGIPVVLDGGSWKPGMEDLLGLVDVAVLSADYDGPTAGPRFVARSRGADPIEFSGKLLPVPAVKVVDTLGAGDVLHGGFAHYFAGKNLKATEVEEALARAATLASFSCSFPGAKGWHSAPWSKLP